MKNRFTFFILLAFLNLFTYAIVQAQVDTLWTKTFGGGYNDYGNSVQQTTDGGYITVGYTSSYGAGGPDGWMIKTNASGDTLWTKTFGGNVEDWIWSVQQTTDWGYIMVGGTSSFGAGSSDGWLIKTNASGDTLWTKTFGGGDNDYDNSVRQTTDEGYILVGVTESFGAGNSDIWLIKTNASGDTLWTKTFGGDDNDYGNSVQQTTDEGYIIVGVTESFGAGNSDIWLIKTNASGDTLWTKTFGGISLDRGYSVQQITDGGYILVGTTPAFGAGYYNDAIWLIKTDVYGDTLWTKTFGGSDYDWGRSVQQMTDRGYIIVGCTYSFGAGYSDVWLIKTTPDANIIEQYDDIIPFDYSLRQNYPNPFNPVTQVTYSLPQSNHVTLTIHDLLGKEVQTLVNEYQTVGSYSVNFDASDLSSGIYFYQLKVGNNFIATKKMILTR